MSHLHVLKTLLIISILCVLLVFYKNKSTSNITIHTESLINPKKTVINLFNKNLRKMQRKCNKIYEPGYLIPVPKICPNLGKQLKLVIIITSAIKNFKERTRIRNTWGHYAIRKDVSIAFILGRPGNKQTKKASKKLKEEQFKYKDIIQGKFVDTYNNLTLKSLSIMEWVSNYCLKAKFVLKTDDDMFNNISTLLNFIENLKTVVAAFYGYLADKSAPIRDKNHKWYVSKYDFRNEQYPPYITGPAYLFPAMLATYVYRQGLTEICFKLEDVFITAIVAPKLGIGTINHFQFRDLENIGLSPCAIENTISYRYTGTFPWTIQSRCRGAVWFLDSRTFVFILCYSIMYLRRHCMTLVV